MHRVRIKYKKGVRAIHELPLLIFIGHLDMVRLWERAIRRADIPVSYSQGFNPRQKLSFGPPLSLGIASECEFLDIYSDKWMNPEEIKNRLSMVLPSGIEIIETNNVFEGLPSLSATITKAEYGAQTEGIDQKTLDDILASSEINVQRKDKTINIRPMIKNLSLQNNTLRITVRCDNSGSVKAEEIRKLFSKNNIKDLTRTNLF